MAFVVQDPTTPKSDANAYIAVQTFKDYHDDRGNDYSSFSDTDIEKAIVRATDYIDSRWTFAGYRDDADQSTECPRSGVKDPRTGYWLDGYPSELEEACSEYALTALSGSLYATPNVDDTGKSVKSSRKKIAVLETETEYYQSGGTTSSKWLGHPVADGKMRKTGLLQVARRTLGRA
jgi:hypothetical protein